MFKIMAFIGIKPPKSSKRLKKKLYVSISKKLPKLNKKTQRKTGRLD